MGKRKISVTIDSTLAEKIDRLTENGKFRNRSHVLEYGVRKLIEDEDV